MAYLARDGTIMKTYFIDTETTGLNPRMEGVVELAVLDETGMVIVDTLLNPGKPIPEAATAVHGITDAMVQGKPKLADLWPTLESLFQGQRVVAYNAAYDRKFFPNDLNDSEVVCCMHRFTRWHRRMEVQPDRQYRTINLAKAAEFVGHVWGGDAHRALADTRACLSVWNWLEQHEVPGINIFSGAHGLGAALTNPTEKGVAKGTLKHSYPVVFRGKRYVDAEAAYKANKRANEEDANDEIMAEIICAKLTQYPRLAKTIAEQGGENFLFACSHKTQATTPQAKSWEGEGMQSRFLRNLRKGWLQYQNQSQNQAG